MEYTIRDDGYVRSGQVVKAPRRSRSLSFLYTHKLGRLLRPLVTSGIANAIMRVYMNSRWSRRHIKSFVARHNINTDEMSRPIRSYRSFNDFFTRRLALDARPIDSDQNAIVSPADGKLFCIPTLNASDIFLVKGKPFNLARFLGDQRRAALYTGGTCVIVRLAPEDYHRYHFPASGTPHRLIPISGRYDSVQPLVYKKRQPLVTNKRHIIEISSSRRPFCMIPVGALCVGRIVETYSPGRQYAKGDEAGYFAFGGSTIVLLFPKSSVQLRADLIQNSRRGYETCVRMGEAIAQWLI